MTGNASKAQPKRKAQLLQHSTDVLNDGLMLLNTAFTHGNALTTAQHKTGFRRFTEDILLALEVEEGDLAVPRQLSVHAVQQ